MVLESQPYLNVLLIWFSMTARLCIEEGSLASTPQVIQVINKPFSTPQAFGE